MIDKVDDYVQRPGRYQNIDGLWEMGIGFMFLTLTLLDKSLTGAPKEHGLALARHAGH